MYAHMSRKLLTSCFTWTPENLVNVKYINYKGTQLYIKIVGPSKTICSPYTWNCHIKKYTRGKEEHRQGVWEQGGEDMTWDQERGSNKKMEKTVQGGNSWPLGSCIKIALDTRVCVCVCVCVCLRSSVLCCPVQVEVLWWADPLSKESYQNV